MDARVLQLVRLFLIFSDMQILLDKIYYVLYSISVKEV